MPESEHKINELAETLNNWDLADFADHLLTARSLWRTNRELVEAPNFPEHLRGPYMKRYEAEPESEDLDYGTPFLTEGMIEKNRSAAEEAVKRAA